MAGLNTTIYSRFAVNGSECLLSAQELRLNEM